MRKEIKIFQDQYELCKVFKSKKLLRAFAEFMFEDIEPKNLTEKEQKIFNSFTKRMENFKKKIDGNKKGGEKSCGGGRPQKTSGELETENKSKTSQKQVKNKSTNNKEEDNISLDILIEEEVVNIPNGIFVDESTKSKFEEIYELYPFRGKGIDKQVCDKLIDKQLKQGATIKGILKEMKLEELELRISQGLSYRYGRKFETRIKEYVEGMADSEDRLKKLLVEHRKRLENGPKYKKNPRDELCDLFGNDYVKKLFMETKQGVKLFTT